MNLEKPNNWKDVIDLPIITNGKSKWNLEEFEKIMTRSIALCAKECFFKNKEAICTTLSGGLDSSFCLAKMRELVGLEIPIFTFTIGGSKEHPDVQFAREVSQYFKTIHHELIPSKKEIKEVQRKLSFQWEDEPFSLGDIAVFLIYEKISSHGFRCVIVHDGIDELLGGYWEHREHKDEQKKKKVFRDFWGKLEKEHLLLLERKASFFGIEIVFPYLQKDVVEYIARIPLNSRTTFKESKIPLRDIAKKYLPGGIIKRKKKGFCGALDKE
jgi:asparagine synthetase B (glutamine-hydrolysing)